MYNIVKVYILFELDYKKTNGILKKKRGNICFFFFFNKCDLALK